MKKIFFYFIFLTIGIKQNIIAQTHQFSLQSTGAYFFDDAGYKYNMPYQQMKLPTTISYLNIKNKSGIQLTATKYSFRYAHLNTKFNSSGEKLTGRIGLLISADYLHSLLKKKNFDSYLKVGISSKQSNTNISINYLSCFYPGLSQLGGLALNLGLNANLKISKHFYFTSNLRSVNFILGGNNQRNSFWFENGISYRFENSAQKKEERNLRKGKRNPKYTQSFAINTTIYNHFGRAYKQTGFYLTNRPNEKTFNYKIQKNRFGLEFFKSNYYDFYYRSNEYIFKTIPIGNLLFEQSSQTGVTFQYALLQNRHISLSPFIGLVRQKYNNHTY